MFSVEIPFEPGTTDSVRVRVSAAGIQVHGGGCDGPTWTWAEARKLGAKKTKPKTTKPARKGHESAPREGAAR